MFLRCARVHGMLSPVVKRAALCVILLAMPARTFTASGSLPAASAKELAALPPVAAALDWLVKNVSWINDEQARIVSIPAPPFKEAERAAAMRTTLAAAGLRVHFDSVGNVVGELRGVNENEVVIVSAHLDTVFPAGTDVRVQREGDRLIGPGIADNGTGLAALVALAKALRFARLKPQRSILFIANVGEEGEGNLRGMRAVVDTYRDRLKGALVLDGAGIDHVTTKALASRRLEVVITGPGGHSWSDFGLPNPINALVRGALRFINTRVPSSPRTTFNLGEIQGGTSVNAIPHEARLKVDLRSESEEELARLENALREAIAAGVRDETQAASRSAATKLEWSIDSLGSRPGGEGRPDSPLLAALRSADDYLGNESRLERSSTDANIPLSQGLDAISIGAGGQGGGAHSLQEWYDPSGRERGLKRALLTLLGVSGVAPERAK
ncbi:MAG TPA: M20/M25/M40 family metallo-hydrolase [Methylomirabilota bacterium]|nr:M20/M25/M40 family metallo-hydrolase [Methylomirabilota bacterium]